MKAHSHSPIRAAQTCIVLAAALSLSACAGTRCATGGKHVEAGEYPMLAGADSVNAPTPSSEFAIPAVGADAPAPPDPNNRNSCLDTPPTLAPQPSKS